MTHHPRWPMLPQARLPGKPGRRERVDRTPGRLYNPLPNRHVGQEEVIAMADHEGRRRRAHAVQTISRAALALSALVVATLLVACGGGASQAPAGSAPAPAGSPAAAPAQ